MATVYPGPRSSKEPKQSLFNGSARDTRLDRTVPKQNLKPRLSDCTKVAYPKNSYRTRRIAEEQAIRWLMQQP